MRVVRVARLSPIVIGSSPVIRAVVVVIVTGLVIIG